MIPALLLIISAVVFRIATGFFGQHSDQIGWLNFAPIVAIALCVCLLPAELQIQCSNGSTADL
jgi:hypothetical protein